MLQVRKEARREVRKPILYVMVRYSEVGPLKVDQSCQQRKHMDNKMTKFFLELQMFLNFYFILFYFAFLRATPVVYGGSQSRGEIGGTAAGLHHSHTRSEPRLRPTPQLTATWDPLTH